MKNKILTYGEIIWDIYPDKQAIGGAPLNFAAHAVLNGAEAALISAVGDDALGRDALCELADFGVDTRFVKTAEAPTGQCLVTLDAASVPHYNVLRGVAYDRIELTAADSDAVNAAHYDAFYFGTLIQRDAVSRATLQKLLAHCSFPTVICDVNLRPDCYDRASVALCLKYATVLKVSIEEEPLLRTLTDYTPADDTPLAIAQALCAANSNLKVVLITLGKQGSFAYTPADQAAYSQPAIGDKVVSTVGAGDSFAAAFLTSYLFGAPIPACMQKAAEVSGFVVAHTQAVPKY